MEILSILLNLIKINLMCLGMIGLGVFLQYLSKEKIWTSVFIFGGIAIMIANFFEVIAVDILGRDPGVMFYLIIFISVVILALVENILGILAGILNFIYSCGITMKASSLNIVIATVVLVTLLIPVYTFLALTWIF